jgi:hypothetical protein
LETLSEASVTGAKGVGEGGTIGAPAAVSRTRLGRAHPVQTLRPQRKEKSAVLRTIKEVAG